MRIFWQWGGIAIQSSAPGESEMLRKLLNNLTVGPPPEWEKFDISARKARDLPETEVKTLQSLPNTGQGLEHDDK